MGGADTTGRGDGGGQVTAVELQDYAAGDLTRALARSGGGRQRPALYGTAIGPLVSR